MITLNIPITYQTQDNEAYADALNPALTDEQAAYVIDYLGLDIEALTTDRQQTSEDDLALQLQAIIDDASAKLDRLQTAISQRPLPPIRGGK